MVRPVEITREQAEEIVKNGWVLGLWIEGQGLCLPPLIAWRPEWDEGQRVRTVEEVEARANPTDGFWLAPRYGAPIEKTQIRVFDPKAYNGMVRLAQKQYDLEQMMKARVEALPPFANTPANAYGNSPSKETHHAL